LIALLGGGFGLLAARAVFQRRHQTAAASAAGLAAIHDLAHLPPALQRTALWSLSDGGFESRVVHGTVSRGAHDVGVTAFDLETLRERRGEWAYLPVARSASAPPSASSCARSTARSATSSSSARAPATTSSRTTCSIR
jgi:hypothetical protein